MAVLPVKFSNFSFVETGEGLDFFDVSELTEKPFGNALGVFQTERPNDFADVV